MDVRPRRVWGARRVPWRLWAAGLVAPILAGRGTPTLRPLRVWGAYRVAAREGRRMRPLVLVVWVYAERPRRVLRGLGEGCANRLIEGVLVPHQKSIERAPEQLLQFADAVAEGGGFGQGILKRHGQPPGASTSC